MGGPLWESREDRSELACALDHIQQAGGLGGFKATRSRSLALIVTAHRRRYVRWSRRRQRYELTQTGCRYIGAPEPHRATPSRFTLVAGVVACVAITAWFAIAGAPGTGSNAVAQVVKQGRDLAMLGDGTQPAPKVIKPSAVERRNWVAYDDTDPPPAKVAARSTERTSSPPSTSARTPEVSRKKAPPTVETERPKSRKISTSERDGKKHRKIAGVPHKPAKPSHARTYHRPTVADAPIQHGNPCSHRCVESGI